VNDGGHGPPYEVLRPMLTYALRRLATAVPTLLVLVTACFVLMRAAPGGPFDRARALPPALEQALAAAYHLDESPLRQYLRYLGNLARGDLGPSFQYEGYRVSELIGAGVPVSFTLGLGALALALLLGGAAGLLAARRPDSALDHGLRVAAAAGLALPTFVIAPLLILAFALGLGWLPAGGWEHWTSAVLPTVALALPPMASIARLMRGSMLEVLRQDYIRAARAKGLPESAVILRHALKPALLPVVAWLGPAAAALITGSVVIEQVFNLPGIGRYFVQGAINRDYTLVMGVVVFYGALIIAFNLIADLLQAVLDPRLRHRPS